MEDYTLMRLTETAAAGHDTDRYIPGRSELVDSLKKDNSMKLCCGIRLAYDLCRLFINLFSTL